MARELHIDVLKLVAAQLIMLHHFSAYGPLSQAMHSYAPGASSWLFNDARKSVQVFLVIAGFLAARSLAPDGLLKPGSNLHRIINRYLRLVLPFLIALGISVVCAAWARTVLGSSFIPAEPELLQLLAHVLLLQGPLGWDALSAGIWYVAIDFQLFALMIALLSTGKFSSRLALILFFALVLASLFYFNRHAQWDNWALYFFGAYGMGALAYWGGQSRHALVGLAWLVLPASAALMLEYRGRIALALGVALFLFLIVYFTSTKSRIRPSTLKPIIPEPAIKIIQVLGRSSYALFLLHFPLLMLSNGFFELLHARGWLTTPPGIFIFLFVSLLACTALALVFERRVEQPMNQRFRL